MVGGLGLQFHGSNPRTGMRSSDRHQPGRRAVIRALTGRRGGRAQLRVAVWVGLAALALAGCVSEEDLLSDSQSPPIDDDDPPPGDLSMRAPDDVSGEATGIATDVELGDPDASGGDGQYTFGHDAPAGGFALGNSVVTWTVTDGNGATATDAQQVVLVDTTAPFIEDPADLQTVASGALTPVTLAVPAVSDVVDASPVVVNDQPAGGFPLGTTEVTWMATDASGNSATVLQYVTIVDGDPGGPLTLAAPADRNLEATGATTAVDLGSATASGGMPPLSITNDAPAGGYPLGTTTVTWTVTDMGAMSVTDTQIVLVADTTAPALAVPGAITRTQSSSGGLTAVDLGTATASDLVDPSPALVNDAPGGFPLGATTVTWTASDASGNSRSATQQVTIVAFAPESCESLVEVFADEIYPLLDRADPLTCNGCHTGSAPLATPNGFAFPNSPPGTEDFDVFRAVAMLDAGGQSLVLVKARGGATHTGGDRFPAGNGDPDFLALADFVNRARGCEEEPTGGTEKVELGTPYEQLHRIAGVLASRPPTADEIATVAAATDQASLLSLLDPIIDGMLDEDAFYERVVEMYNDLLLTDQYANSTRNVGSNFALDSFAARNYYETNYSGATRDALRRDTNYGIARAPLELIRHVVRNDRPFTEILTADYTMVNPYAAVIFGVNAGDPDFPFSSDGVRANHDRDEFRPVNRIVQTAGDQSVVPAAGVLATYSYLKRYPTTATNLNRKRARFTLMYFLGTDIEELAPRDALDLGNEVGAIPTYQDPQCTVCHDVMDPVAGLFTKRNNGGDYDIDIVYEWTRTRFGVQRMVPAGFGNTRVNASAQLPDAYLERPLQWLGQRMAADDRFAVQTARKVLRSLTGTAAESAPAVQFVNELRSAFVQSGYDFKALVKRIVTSEFFLARNLAATENPQAYSDLGTGRLMSPEELDRKLTAWLGAGYRWAGPATDSGLRGMHYLPYGGIDSDEIISRPTSATALIDGIQERIANQVACERVARDLRSGGPLFPDAGVGDTPDTQAGRNAIRANIRYLHRYLLGEDLAATDPEIESSYQLFVAARALGETNIPTECRGGGGSTDTQRTVLPWMALVTYLLGDYRFVYD